MASKAQRTKVRFQVTKAFDYLTAGREYDFEYSIEGSKRGGYVDVRRTDGSGIGTYLQMWQFRQALANGLLAQVSA